MRIWAKARPMRVEATRVQAQRDFSHATATRPGPGCRDAEVEQRLPTAHSVVRGAARRRPAAAAAGGRTGGGFRYANAHHRGPGSGRGEHDVVLGEGERRAVERPGHEPFDSGRMPGREVRHHPVEHAAPRALDRRREAALVEVPRGGLEAADVGERNPGVEYGADSRRRRLAGGAGNGAVEERVRGRGRSGDEDKKSDGGTQHERNPGRGRDRAEGAGRAQGPLEHPPAVAVKGGEWHA